MHVRPCAGQMVSGDVAVVFPIAEGVFAAIADVLGHGREANALAEQIAAYLAAEAGPDLVGLMRRLHERLKGSLGPAVGIAFLEAAGGGRLRYVGVGNTCLRRFGSAETQLISRDGTVGCHLSTPREATLQLEAGDLVLLTTDGVRERFGLEDYPGLHGDSPSVLARRVVEKFGKDHDDAACLALRYRP